MTRPVAIFLYELSGKSAEPFAAAGWDCYCIDIAHERGHSKGNIHFIRADARVWKPTRDMVERCRFFAAFPPCDHLAVSGSRWFKGKGLRALSLSIDLFAVAAEWAEFFEVPYLIENPVSTISTYWRKPDHAFDPADYSIFDPSDHYTKKTCLWTGGGFVMPAKARADRDGVPYEKWAADGLIRICPGSIIAENMVEEEIRELAATYDVQEVGFDPHLAQRIMQRLYEDGLPVVEVRQGPLTMGAAGADLERIVNGRLVRHDGHPILRHHLASVVAVRTDTGLVKMHKGRKTDRIDGAVAAAMAVYRLSSGETSRSAYDDPARDLLFLE